MSKVHVKTQMGVPAQQIWETIGKFGEIHNWHPAVETTTLEKGGTERRLALVGGGEIVERLEAGDADGKSYTYSILSSPLPVANYKATIRVVEGADGKAEVEWSSEFEPQGQESDAMAVVRGIYETGFNNLKKMYGLS
ncbi:MAG: SRPBCC family protein [Geminicoccaceae bacterium]